MEAVSTWYGAYLIDKGRVLRELRFPDDPAERAERLHRRREGLLAPEEERLITEARRGSIVSRDRRFFGLGVTEGTDPFPLPDLDPPPGTALRELILAAADEAVANAWEVTAHLDEAVRTMTDLDRVRNLLGERLDDWELRDRPSANGTAASTGSETATPTSDEPGLLVAREELRRAVKRLTELRGSLETAVEESASRRLPNLSALLGPVLAARLLSQAGSLERLARFPASTVQLLGAETAFFDHLRRGTKPPRHGLLFLHPAIQGESRQRRGRLARALAGKVAIAARMDRAGAAVDPTLAGAFERRRREIESSGRPGSRRKGGRRSGPPLDRAAEDG